MAAFYFSTDYILYFQFFEQEWVKKMYINKLPTYLNKNTEYMD